MKKAYWVLIGLVLCCVLGFWLWQRDDAPQGEAQRVWRGWRGEAKRNRLVLARDFLAARGIELKIEKLGKLPQAGDSKDEVLLVGASVIDVEAEVLAGLRAWVEEGGYAIVLDNYQFHQYFGLKGKRDNLHRVILVWKDEGVELEVSPESCLFFEMKRKGNKKQSIPYQARLVKQDDKALVCGIERALGKGKLIFLGHDERVWFNESAVGTIPEVGDEKYVPLARADNAAYLHALLQGHRKARLLLSAQSASAPDFAWRLPEKKWWAAIVSVVLACLALLWRGGRRFGTLLEPSVQTGRDMRQHLFAAGQFWAQQPEYGYSWLAEQMRARLQKALSALHIDDEEALFQALAKMSAVPSAQIKCLLTGALPQNEQEFIGFVRIAEQLRTALGRTHE